MNGLIRRRAMMEDDRFDYLTPFLTATSITDATIISALTTLIDDLYNAGIMTRFKALYPFVGGTSTTHKFNLMDAQDLDSSFRLTFSGTSVHSSTGFKPNGSTGYANTHLVPSTTMASKDNISIGFYSRTQQQQTRYGMGSVISNGNVGCDIAPYYNASGALMYTNASTSSAITNTVSTKLCAWSRLDSASFTYILNQTVGSFNRISSSLTDNSVYIGGRNYNGVLNLPSSYEHAFSYISEGLTSSELSALNTAVNTFQTTLGRNV